MNTLTIKEYFYFLNLNNPIEHIITSGIELPGSDRREDKSAKNLFDSKKGKRKGKGRGIKEL